MTAITTTGGGIVNPETISSFINWIDRSDKTTRTYLNNLKQFAAWVRYSGITAPTRDDIINYKKWLQTEHSAIQLDAAAADGWSYRTDGSGNVITLSCSANTTAQYMRSVCQFFKWAAAEGIYRDIANNIHAPKIRHDTHKKDALTAQEVREVENSIVNNAAEKIRTAEAADKDTTGRIQRSTEQGKRLYAIYLLAVNAGMRTIEIHRANVKDLHTKNGQTVIYIWGKGHTEPDERKPIAPEVAAAIKDYLNSRTDHYNSNSPLFVSTGNRSHGKRIATTTISTMIKNALRSAGFDSDRITAHSLRHTAGTAVQAITGDLYQTQKYMRHSNPATTEIYLHNDTEKSNADIAQKLYNYYHAAAADQTTAAATIDQIITILTPAQIEQLQAITAAAQR